MSRTNTYLVKLTNGKEEEVYAPTFMHATAIAIKQHKEKNPDAPEGLNFTDIIGIDADDMVSW